MYLETSVVSYLVGRLSRDVIVLGNQELTREWWASRRGEYSLFISEVVIGEATIGDAELARQRLALATDLPLLGRHGRSRASRTVATEVGRSGA